jgi:ribonucrease Y
VRDLTLVYVMTLLQTVAAFLLAIASSATAGYYLRHLVTLGKKGSLELEIKELQLKAKEEASLIIDEAERKANIVIAEKTNHFREKELDIRKAEDRLSKREESLDKKQKEIDTDVESMKGKVEHIKQIKEKAEQLVKDREVVLEKTAQLTREAARAEIISAVERQSEADVLHRLQKLEMATREKVEIKAKDILVAAIHRVGNSIPADALSTTVLIPNEEAKGKIIGKEGRNIKAFERATGVDVIVDDAPGTITISSFDPIRRQVAKTALESLIADGRIQPARIEELVKKAEEGIERIIKEKGEQAAFEAKVPGMDPRLLNVLGRLNYRTSYGQNVLTHSVEAANLAAIIATEVGANVEVARAGALFHDIGKAVDHETAGTHVEIGRRILQKFNVDERVVKAMESHHEEYPYTSPESYIVQVADAISGGRPGARRDSIENYIKRLEDLEAIAKRYRGVEKAFAIQAGREVRIMVNAKDVGDLEAHHMARDIATSIENEMKYPGEIRVNVIRETRAIEYAR